MSDYKFKPYPEFLEVAKKVEEKFKCDMTKFVKIAIRKHRKTNFKYKMIDKKIEQGKKPKTVRNFDDMDSTIMQSICVQYGKDQLALIKDYSPIVIAKEDKAFQSLANEAHKKLGVF